jgi:hypothetical protein
MQHYVGLDVSVKETSVCIVEKEVMREVKVATKPVAILAVLTEEGLAIERIGLEAGPGWRGRVAIHRAGYFSRRSPVQPWERARSRGLALGTRGRPADMRVSVAATGD